MHATQIGQERTTVTFGKNCGVGSSLRETQKGGHHVEQLHIALDDLPLRSIWKEGGRETGDQRDARQHVVHRAWPLFNQVAVP